MMNITVPPFRVAPQDNVEIVRVKGDVTARLGALWLVGIIDGLLILGAFVMSCWHPDNTKDIWVIVGPIVSGTVSGVVGWWAAGDRNSG